MVERHIQIPSIACTSRGFFLAILRRNLNQRTRRGIVPNCVGVVQNEPTRKKESDVSRTFPRELGQWEELRQWKIDED
jgi:hypothetical protein